LIYDALSHFSCSAVLNVVKGLAEEVRIIKSLLLQALEGRPSGEAATSTDTENIDNAASPDVVELDEEDLIPREVDSFEAVAAK